MNRLHKPPPRWLADCVLAFVALVWGATFVFVKRALADISTVCFLAIRFSLATACMIAMFARPLRHTKPLLLRRGLWGGAFAGLFLWLGYILQTFGLKYTTAGNSGFLTGFYIVLVPLIAACVYRRWPHAREFGGILIATSGMIVLTFPSLGGRFHMNKGDLLTIGCAVAFAFHLLVLGYYSQRERFEAVALGQIACAAVLSASSLVLEPPHVHWTRAVILALGITSIFATAIAFALQTWGQQYTTPTRTALIFALEPVFALATAIAIGGERLTWASAIGGALILAGILAVELRPAVKA